MSEEEQVTPTLFGQRLLWSFPLDQNTGTSYISHKSYCLTSQLYFSKISVPHYLLYIPRTFLELDMVGNKMVVMSKFCTISTDRSVGKVNNCKQWG